MKILIEKDKLRIRTAMSDDAKILSKWWNDGAVMAHAGFPNGLGLSEKEVIGQIRKDNDFNRKLILEYDCIPIGEMSYRTIEEQIAEIGIKICDSKMQNKKYGTIFITMLMKYIFMCMKYKKIRLDTNLNNKRAQYVYEKLGFMKIKTNIDTWKNQLGELQSSVDYEITKEIFLKIHN